MRAMLSSAKPGGMPSSCTLGSTINLICRVHPSIRRSRRACDAGEIPVRRSVELYSPSNLTPQVIGNYFSVPRIVDRRAGRPAPRAASQRAALPSRAAPAPQNGPPAEK